MGIATAALASGDGEWENIQEILRAAFLAHDEQLQAHAKRIDASDQRTTELGAACVANAASLAQYQGLRGHVDALARTVNSLSEELKQRELKGQEQRQQLKTWMDSVTRTIEVQSHSTQARISDVEGACTRALEKLERRMELVEEELGHFVDALESKVDVVVMKTHKKAVDEALKLRCRKAAFDKEVQRVHQLLRSQMSTTTERLELMRAELTEELQSLRQRQDTVAQGTETHKSEIQHQHHNIEREIETSQQKTLAVCGDQVTALKAELELHVSEKLRAQGEMVSKWLADVRVEGQRVERLVEKTNAEAAKMVQELRGCVEPKIDQLQQQQHETEAQLSARIEAASSELRGEVSLLQSKLDEVVQLTTQKLQEQASEAETRQTELADEWSESLKAREKTRQQMHLVADKLREMDQILKLVGKQLVQTTSQVQLMWSEQQEQRDPETGDLDLSTMIEEGESLTIEDQPQWELPAEADGEEIDAVERRISDHQQLQHSIEAKLRDYEEILLLQQQSPLLETT